MPGNGVGLGLCGTASSGGCDGNGVAAVVVVVMLVAMLVVALTLVAKVWHQAGTLRNGCIFGLLHAAECMPFECTLRIRNASALFSRELKSNDSIETA